MNINTAGNVSYVATTILPTIIGMFSQPDWNVSQGQKRDENLKGNFKIEDVGAVMKSHFSDYFRLNRFFVKIELSEPNDFLKGDSTQKKLKDSFIILEPLSYLISEVGIPSFKSEVKILKRMGHVYKKPVRTFYEDEASLKIYLDTNGYIENMVKIIMFETGTQFYNKCKFDITVYKNNSYWKGRKGSPFADDAVLKEASFGDELLKFGKNTLTALNPWGDTLGGGADNIEYLEKGIPRDVLGSNTHSSDGKGYKGFDPHMSPIVKFNRVFITNHDYPILSYSNENQLGEMQLHFGYESMEFENNVFNTLKELDYNI